MRFRRSSTLAVTLLEDRLAVHNFMTKDHFTCSGECLDFLASANDWCTPEDLFACFPDVDRNGLAEQITQLVKFNALLVEGSPQAATDEIYRREWLWGTVAGFYHFSIRNTRFLNGAAARKFMKKRKSWRPSPPLHQTNAGLPKVQALPRTDISDEPFALMRRRRSERKFAGKSISQVALADCLFAGNGIVGFHEDEDFGRLPMSMTPSGGARNPFELYVYVREVAGLVPGFYHYGALDHDLGLVRAGEVAVPPMLGGQKWPAKAAAIVFLVAHFPRSMWKYHLATGYRVVLMEAGFIGQNIALAATHHGLSAVPSGAFDEPLIEGYLGTPPVEAGIILSLSIGKPV